MPAPEIAAIIPCYNGEAFLARAIESALSQTVPVRRVIVVDDASTDGSREVVRSFQASGYPVVLIEAGRNAGPAAARNLGIAAAHEPLLAFLDADDRWEAHHCEAMARLLDAFPEAVLAFGKTREVRGRPAPVVAGSGAGMGHGGSHCEYLLGGMLYENVVPQSAVMVRRSALIEAGGYLDGLRFSEDYDLWLRMAHRHPFAHTDAVTCTRMLHDQQASQHTLQMYRGAWYARARYREYVRRVGGGLSEDAFGRVCGRAYERDLQWAWQTRSLQVLRGVLALSGMVPGGDRLRYRWTWRAIVYWPVWRCMALAWDAARTLQGEGGWYRAGMRYRIEN